MKIRQLILSTLAALALLMPVTANAATWSDVVQALSASGSYSDDSGFTATLEATPSEASTAYIATLRNGTITGDEEGNLNVHAGAVEGVVQYRFVNVQFEGNQLRMGTSEGDLAIELSHGSRVDAEHFVVFADGTGNLTFDNHGDIVNGYEMIAETADDGWMLLRNHAFIGNHNRKVIDEETGEPILNEDGSSQRYPVLAADAKGTSSLNVENHATLNGIVSLDAGDAAALNLLNNGEVHNRINSLAVNGGKVDIQNYGSLEQVYSNAENGGSSALTNQGGSWAIELYARANGAGSTASVTNFGETDSLGGDAEDGGSVDLSNHNNVYGNVNANAHNGGSVALNNYGQIHNSLYSGAYGSESLLNLINHGHINNDMWTDGDGQLFAINAGHVGGTFGGNAADTAVFNFENNSFVQRAEGQAHGGAALHITNTESGTIEEHLNTRVVHGSTLNATNRGSVNDQMLTLGFAGSALTVTNSGVVHGDFSTATYNGSNATVENTGYVHGENVILYACNYENELQHAASAEPSTITASIGGNVNDVIPVVAGEGSQNTVTLNADQIGLLQIIGKAGTTTKVTNNAALSAGVVVDTDGNAQVTIENSGTVDASSIQENIEERFGGKYTLFHQQEDGAGSKLTFTGNAIGANQEGTVLVGVQTDADYNNPDVAAELEATARDTVSFPADTDITFTFSTKVNPVQWHEIVDALREHGRYDANGMNAEMNGNQVYVRHGRIGGDFHLDLGELPQIGEYHFEGVTIDVGNMNIGSDAEQAFIRFDGGTNVYADYVSMNARGAANITVQNEGIFGTNTHIYAVGEEGGNLRLENHGEFYNDGQQETNDEGEPDFDEEGNPIIHPVFNLRTHSDGALTLNNYNRIGGQINAMSNSGKMDVSNHGGIERFYLNNENAAMALNNYAEIHEWLNAQTGAGAETTIVNHGRFGGWTGVFASNDGHATIELHDSIEDTLTLRTHDATGRIEAIIHDGANIQGDLEVSGSGVIELTHDGHVENALRIHPEEDGSITATHNGSAREFHSDATSGTVNFTIGEGGRIDENFEFYAMENGNLTFVNDGNIREVNAVAQMGTASFTNNGNIHQMLSGEAMDGAALTLINNGNVNEGIWAYAAKGSTLDVKNNRWISNVEVNAETQSTASLTNLEDGEADNLYVWADGEGTKATLINNGRAGNFNACSENGAVVEAINNAEVDGTSFAEAKNGKLTATNAQGASVTENMWGHSEGDLTLINYGTVNTFSGEATDHHTFALINHGTVNADMVAEAFNGSSTTLENFGTVHGENVYVRATNMTDASRYADEGDPSTVNVSVGGDVVDIVTESDGGSTITATVNTESARLLQMIAHSGSTTVTNNTDLTAGVLVQPYGTASIELINNGSISAADMTEAFENDFGGQYTLFTDQAAGDSFHFTLSGSGTLTGNEQGDVLMNVATDEDIFSEEVVARLTEEALGTITAPEGTDIDVSFSEKVNPVLWEDVVNSLRDTGAYEMNGMRAYLEGDTVTIQEGRLGGFVDMTPGTLDGVVNYVFGGWGSVHVDANRFNVEVNDEEADLTVTISESSDIFAPDIYFQAESGSVTVNNYGDITSGTDVNLRAVGTGVVTLNNDGHMNNDGLLRTDENGNPVYNEDGEPDWFGVIFTAPEGSGVVNINNRRNVNGMTFAHPNGDSEVNIINDGEMSGIYTSNNSRINITNNLNIYNSLGSDTHAGAVTSIDNNHDIFTHVNTNVHEGGQAEVLNNGIIHGSLHSGTYGSESLLTIINSENSTVYGDVWTEGDGQLDATNNGLIDSNFGGEAWGSGIFTLTNNAQARRMETTARDGATLNAINGETGTLSENLSLSVRDGIYTSLTAQNDGFIREAYLEAQHEANTITFTNNGTIAVPAEGEEIDNDANVGLESSDESKIVFTNNGAIGTRIWSFARSGSTTEIVNNGTVPQDIYAKAEDRGTTSVVNTAAENVGVLEISADGGESKATLVNEAGAFAERMVADAYNGATIEMTNNGALNIDGERLSIDVNAHNGSTIAVTNNGDVLGSVYGGLHGGSHITALNGETGDVAHGFWFEGDGALEATNEGIVCSQNTGDDTFGGVARDGGHFTYINRGTVNSSFHPNTESGSTSEVINESTGVIKGENVYLPATDGSTVIAELAGTMNDVVTETFYDSRSTVTLNGDMALLQIRADNGDTHVINNTDLNCGVLVQTFGRANTEIVNNGSISSEQIASELAEDLGGYYALYTFQPEGDESRLAVRGEGSITPNADGAVLIDVSTEQDTNNPDVVQELERVARDSVDVPVADEQIIVRLNGQNFGPLPWNDIVNTLHHEGRFEQGGVTAVLDNETGSVTVTGSEDGSRPLKNVVLLYGYDGGNPDEQGPNADATNYVFENVELVGEEFTVDASGKDFSVTLGENTRANVRSAFFKAENGSLTLDNKADFTAFEGELKFEARENGTMLVDNHRVLAADDNHVYLSAEQNSAITLNNHDDLYAATQVFIFTHDETNGSVTLNNYGHIHNGSREETYEDGSSGPFPVVNLYAGNGASTTLHNQQGGHVSGNVTAIPAFNGTMTVTNDGRIYGELWSQNGGTLVVNNNDYLGNLSFEADSDTSTTIHQNGEIDGPFYGASSGGTLNIIFGDGARVAGDFKIDSLTETNITLRGSIDRWMEVNMMDASTLTLDNAATIGKDLSLNAYNGSTMIVTHSGTVHGENFYMNACNRIADSGNLSEEENVGEASSITATFTTDSSVNDIVLEAAGASTNTVTLNGHVNGIVQVVGDSSINTITNNTELTGSMRFEATGNAVTRVINEGTISGEHVREELAAEFGGKYALYAEHYDGGVEQVIIENGDNASLTNAHADGVTVIRVYTDRRSEEGMEELLTAEAKASITGTNPDLMTVIFSEPVRTVYLNELIDALNTSGSFSGGGMEAKIENGLATIIGGRLTGIVGDDGLTHFDLASETVTGVTQYNFAGVRIEATHVNFGATSSDMTYTFNPRTSVHAEHGGAFSEHEGGTLTLNNSGSFHYATNMHINAQSGDVFFNNSGSFSNDGQQFEDGNDMPVIGTNADGHTITFENSGEIHGKLDLAARNGGTLNASTTEGSETGHVSITNEPGDDFAPGAITLDNGGVIHDGFHINARGESASVTVNNLSTGSINSDSGSTADDGAVVQITNYGWLNRVDADARNGGQNTLTNAEGGSSNYLYAGADGTGSVAALTNEATAEVGSFISASDNGGQTAMINRGTVIGLDTSCDNGGIMEVTNEGTVQENVYGSVWGEGSELTFTNAQTGDVGYSVWIVGNGKLTSTNNGVVSSRQNPNTDSTDSFGARAQDGGDFTLINNGTANNWLNAQSANNATIHVTNNGTVEGENVYLSADEHATLNANIGGTTKDVALEAWNGSNGTLTLTGTSNIIQLGGWDIGLTATNETTLTHGVQIKSYGSANIELINNGSISAESLPEDLHRDLLGGLYAIGVHQDTNWNGQTTLSGSGSITPSEEGSVLVNVDPGDHDLSDPDVVAEIKNNARASVSAQDGVDVTVHINGVEENASSMWDRIIDALRSGNSFSEEGLTATLEDGVVTITGGTLTGDVNIYASALDEQNVTAYQFVGVTIQVDSFLLDSESGTVAFDLDKDTTLTTAEARLSIRGTSDITFALNGTLNGTLRADGESSEAKLTSIIGETGHVTGEVKVRGMNVDMTNNGTVDGNLGFRPDSGKVKVTNNGTVAFMEGDTSNGTVEIVNGETGVVHSVLGIYTEENGTYTIDDPATGVNQGQVGLFYARVYGGAVTLTNEGTLVISDAEDASGCMRGEATNGVVTLINRAGSTIAGSISSMADVGGTINITNEATPNDGIYVESTNGGQTFATNAQNATVSNLEGDAYGEGSAVTLINQGTISSRLAGDAIDGGSAAIVNEGIVNDRFRGNTTGGTLSLDNRAGATVNGSFSASAFNGGTLDTTNNGTVNSDFISLRATHYTSGSDTADEGAPSTLTGTLGGTLPDVTLEVQGGSTSDLTLTGDMGWITVGNWASDVTLTNETNLDSGLLVHPHGNATTQIVNSEGATITGTNVEPNRANDLGGQYTIFVDHESSADGKVTLVNNGASDAIAANSNGTLFVRVDTTDVDLTNEETVSALQAKARSSVEAPEYVDVTIKLSGLLDTTATWDRIIDALRQTGSFANAATTATLADGVVTVNGGKIIGEMKIDDLTLSQLNATAFNFNSVTIEVDTFLISASHETLTFSFDEGCVLTGEDVIFAANSTANTTVNFDGKLSSNSMGGTVLLSQSSSAFLKFTLGETGKVTGDLSAIGQNVTAINDGDIDGTFSFHPQGGIVYATNNGRTTDFFGHVTEGSAVALNSKTGIVESMFHVFTKPVDAPVETDASEAKNEGTVGQLFAEVNSGSVSLINQGKILSSDAEGADGCMRAEVTNGNVSMINDSGATIAGSIEGIAHAGGEIDITNWAELDGDINVSAKDGGTIKATNTRGSIISEIWGDAMGEGSEVTLNNHGTVSGSMGGESFDGTRLTVNNSGSVADLSASALSGGETIVNNSGSVTGNEISLGAYSWTSNDKYDAGSDVGGTLIADIGGTVENLSLRAQGGNSAIDADLTGMVNGSVFARGEGIANTDNDISIALNNETTLTHGLFLSSDTTAHFALNNTGSISGESADDSSVATYGGKFPICIERNLDANTTVRLTGNGNLIRNADEDGEVLAFIHTSMDLSDPDHVEAVTVDVLNSLNLPNDVEAIVVFPDHDEITRNVTLVLPANLQRIESEAFAGNQKATKVILSETVTYVGSNAFNDCDSLLRVVFPHAKGAALTLDENAFGPVKTAKNQITIVCYRDSEAYKFAVAHDFKIELMD